ncbi:MAG: hypothetical protein M1839_005085 [Geoglossum umbratile]|nr:MAG: hypothetical protein M1839_005085 [Geoglossum umbratile]
MVEEDADSETLRHEIAGLEKTLRDAKAALKQRTGGTPGVEEGTVSDVDEEGPLPLPRSHHALLLLSDSALPLGSFAFSSGLESYLAHSAKPPNLSRFVQLSLASVVSAALPYVLAAHRRPALLPRLDNDHDASLACAVARRASVAQGRALLGVWERAFRRGGPWVADGGGGARDALDAFRGRLRGADPPAGHLAPLWGVVGRAMGLPRRQVAHLFLFNHVKALVSAAVRAGVVGPYQAQALLAAEWVRGAVWEAVRRAWAVRVEDAGQVVPVLDLYQGRHELLYSRIFNS